MDTAPTRSPMECPECGHHTGPVHRRQHRQGAAVRDRRSELRLTQVQLAEAAECTQSALSDIERGRAGMSLALAQRLARALSTTTSDLFDEAVAS